MDSGCNLFLPFAQHVAQAVWSHYEKDAIRDAIEFVHAEGRLSRRRAVNLLKGSLKVLNSEETTFLRRVAAVFRQSDPDTVALEDN